MSDIFDRLPKACPTCGSEQPTTYYGSCFDNQHSTIFDPRLPMDPWHAYMNQLSRSLRKVESLESQRDVYLRLLAERDERIGAAEAERDALAARLDSILDAIGDPDELRWHRWHCDDTGNGDDLRDLLVRIADAADAARGEAPTEARPETCPRCGSDRPTKRISSDGGRTHCGHPFHSTEAQETPNG